MTKKRSTRGLVAHVLPAALYGLCIFVGGSLPQGPDTGLDWEYQDKLLHLLAFGGFVPLSWRAFRYLRPERPGSWHVQSAFALSIALGAGLEVWQAFLPSRQAEVLDLVADALGALVAALLVWSWARQRPAATERSG